MSVKDKKANRNGAQFLFGLAWGQEVKVERTAYEATSNHAMPSKPFESRRHFSQLCLQP